MKPAKNIKELVVSQLACRLSEAIDRMVSHSAAKRHRKLCDQISRSSSSVAANLAEGFGRFRWNLLEPAEPRLEPPGTCWNLLRDTVRPPPANWTE